MHVLHLKPTHRAIKTYYNELQQLSLLEAGKESTVAPAFANLLRHCARQFNWTLYEQYPLKHDQHGNREDCEGIAGVGGSKSRGNINTSNEVLKVFEVE